MCVCGVCGGFLAPWNLQLWLQEQFYIWGPNFGPILGYNWTSRSAASTLQSEKRTKLATVCSRNACAKTVRQIPCWNPFFCLRHSKPKSAEWVICRRQASSLSVQMHTMACRMRLVSLRLEPPVQDSRCSRPNQSWYHRTFCRHAHGDAAALRSGVFSLVCIISGCWQLRPPNQAHPSDGLRRLHAEIESLARTPRGVTKAVDCSNVDLGTPRANSNTNHKQESREKSK